MSGDAGALSTAANTAADTSSGPSSSVNEGGGEEELDRERLGEGAERSGRGRAVKWACS